MSVLFKSPLEFWSVHLAVTIVVHAAEYDSEASDSVHSATLQSLQHFREDLTGRLSLSAEGWVDIWIVSSSHQSKESSEFLVIKFAIARLVVFPEERLQFFLLQGASKSF